MGGTTSRPAKILPIESFDWRELVLQFHRSLCAKDESPAYRDSVTALARRIITQCAAGEKYTAVIAYYSNLANKKEQFKLFLIATELSNRVNKLWLVNEATLLFLDELHVKNKEAYFSLIDQFAALCLVKEINLSAAHLDIAVAALRQQQRLPADLLAYVTPFAERDYEGILRALRLTHGPELDKTALATCKLHHAVPHALEIGVRSINVLDGLGLFPKDKPVMQFLRAVIRFIIEFHDQEQIFKGDFSSIEEATAFRVLSWLKSAFALDAHPQLAELFAYLTNRIIVLGTTMIFSTVQTLDLSELYLLIERTALEADIKIYPDTNKDLYRLVHTSMLITGVCDKNPASMLSIVKTQAEHSDLSTYNLLRAHCGTASMMGLFFTYGGFKPYYKSSLTDEDYQAFCITLTPHLAMRIELCAASNAELVTKIIHFVHESRLQRLSLPLCDFMAWYHAEFAKRALYEVVATLFFTAIDREIQFCLSQRGSLQSTVAHLHSLSLPMVDTTPLIDSDVPIRDADNLTTFKRFYDNLPAEGKTVLVKELVLIVIMQAGAIYSHDPVVGYYPPSAGTGFTSHTGTGLSLFAAGGAGDSLSMSIADSTPRLRSGS